MTAIPLSSFSLADGGENARPMPGLELLSRPCFEQGGFSFLTISSPVFQEQFGKYQKGHDTPALTGGPPLLNGGWVAK